MIINNNIPALNTHRQMGINQNAMQNSMEKLSSGMRINRAGDDAAGLAISEKMRAQINGLDQASRNAQDGISMIQTAEGALDETHSILQRMRELATQAANDTNVDVDREEIQKEMNELTSEINRIGNTTEFNTQNLLDGSRSRDGEVESQVLASEDAFNFNFSDGISYDGNISASNLPNFTNDGTDNEIGIEAGDFRDAIGDLDQDGDGTIKITRDGDDLRVELTALDDSGDVAFSSDDLISVNDDGDFVYDNHGVSFTLSSDEFEKMDNGSSVEISGIADDATEAGTSNMWDSMTVADGDDPATATDFTTTASDMFPDAHSIQVSGTSDGTDSSFTVVITDAAGNELSNDTFEVEGGTELNYNNHGVSFTMNMEEATEASFSHTFETETQIEELNNSANFQVGANQNQAINLSIGDMRADALGISGTGDTLTFTNRDGEEETINLTSTSDVTDGTDATGVERALDVSSHENATKAITVINNAIESVSAERSMLGATQNRLEHTISNLNNASENLSAAESRIRDVDMAAEMMEMTRANILSQASQSMLAQANQQPQSVLQLLG